MIYLFVSCYLGQHALVGYCFWAHPKLENTPYQHSALIVFIWLFGQLFSSVNHFIIPSPHVWLNWHLTRPVYNSLPLEVYTIGNRSCYVFIPYRMKIKWNMCRLKQLPLKVSAESQINQNSHHFRPEIIGCTHLATIATVAIDWNMKMFSVFSQMQALDVGTYLRITGICTKIRALR